MNKKIKKHRNFTFAVIVKQDPKRISTKVRKSEKGKSRKLRPRKKAATQDEY